MITQSERSPQRSIPDAWQAKFIDMLPAIETQARRAFRRESHERKEELIAETIANCWVAYVRLKQRGLDHVIYPTPLCAYAVCHVRSGRLVGSRLNINDVTSERARQFRRVNLHRLDQYDRRMKRWKEILIEDRRTGPAETAAVRIDFDRWLGTLNSRMRQIAEALSVGESTYVAAKKYGVSPGRISQIRRRLEHLWNTFQGEQ